MRVFISHSVSDKAFADRLTAALRERQVDVWAANDIRAGDEFAKAITDAVSNADAVIPVISRASAESPAVAAEVAMAIANQLEGGRKRIVPVLAERSVETPFFLRNLQWVDLSDETKFNANIDRLIKGLPPEGNTDVDGLGTLKIRGEWLKTQRAVLEVESRALEYERHKQLRYVTMALASASMVAVVGAVSFTQLKRIADFPVWTILASSIISFIVGAYTSGLAWRASRTGRRDDE